MAEVNIDVAKESTGQQILSSGAKEATSQEILSKLANSGGAPKVQALKLTSSGFFQARTASDAIKSIAIAGKGKLYSAALILGVLYQNKEGTIVIKIDGKVVLDRWYNNTAGSLFLYVGIVNPKYLWYAQSANSSGQSATWLNTPYNYYPNANQATMNPQELLTIPGSGAGSYGVSVLDLSSERVDRTIKIGGSYLHEFALIDDYIPFDESVEISVAFGADSNNYANGAISLLYTLDD